MNRALRVLMGIALLFILAPALAMTMPQTFDDLNPWNDEEIATTSDPIVLAGPGEEPSSADVDGDSSSAIAGASQISAPMPPPPPPPDFTTTTGVGELAAAAAGERAAEGSPDETDTGESDSTTQAPKSTPTTAAKKASAPTQPSDHSDHDTGSNSSPVVTGTITGSACPCTVTDTVELKGKVSLQGDLMVMGGTLVARPGVSVDGNGHQIMFMNGGSADFQGSKTSTWSGNGGNANLKRDVNFRNLRRIMFHDGAGKSTLRYISVADSGGGSMGEYPLHWHLNGNSTRGTLVEGVVVVNGKHHAFVPHGSHGITFRNTIAKNIKGDAYWWDPGRGANCSNDTVYDHALADGVTNNPGDNRGFQLAAFRLGCGKGNVIKNSVARNVNPSNPKNCSGYHWPENDEGVWGFVNNASYGSACNGIFVWQNTSSAHVINGFRGDGIENGAYVNQYIYRDLDVEFIKAHALGRDGTNVLFENGKVGQVQITAHTVEGEPMVFRNLQIGTFTINNGDGSVPGTYVLDNTNIACGDVRYESVKSGTRVIINGSTC